MERRTFLTGLGGVALAARFPAIVGAQEPTPHIGIVGAGIVGASIAYHLARAGARVTIFEKDAPASGATSKSFAWLNSFSNDPGYRELRRQALLDWRRLDGQLGGALGVTWGGYLVWRRDPARAQALRDEVADFSAAGYPYRLIDEAGITTLQPGIVAGRSRAAAFMDMDGHIDPVHATTVLVERAKVLGARIVNPCAVTGIIAGENGLTAVETGCGTFPLDRLVIAAGVDTPVLTAQLGTDIPMTHAPGILVHTKSLPPMLRPIIDGPDVYFKQMPNGRIVGADAEAPPDIAAHSTIRRGVADFGSESVRSMHGTRILGKIAAVLPASRGAPLLRLTLGFRPKPADGFPAVGPLAGALGIYAAVMHSGMTLGPLMGRLVAGEILNGIPSPLLAPYRPERFSN